MSWRDNLRKASFRGVEFHFEDSSLDAGRRQQIHVYPGRDIPYAEDLGRKAREFALTGYVIGDDYIVRRDAILAAIEKKGSGALVHPYWGERNVVVTQCKILETRAEGRMARLDFTFIEAGENRFPDASTATAALAASEADSLLSGIDDFFDTSFAVSGFPQFVEEAAVATSTTLVTGLLKEAEKYVKAATAAADLIRGGDSMLLDLTGLVRNPPGLASDLIALFGNVTSAVSSATDRFHLFGDIARLPAAIPFEPRLTPSGIRRDDNRNALGNFFLDSSLAEMVRATSERQFASYDEAVAARESLDAQLSTAIRDAADAGNDDRWLALRTLRTAAIADITTRSGQLARVVTRILPATRPALVEAYDLYDDAARDADIVARNSIRHPGFLPSGIPLEVLAA
jgi:prophage DNA circulation protein